MRLRPSRITENFGTKILATSFVLALVSACSGGTTDGPAGSGGAATIGSGGVAVGSGGAPVGSGGQPEPGTGGIDAGTGGVVVGSGGADIGSGGGDLGSGGADVGSGGDGSGGSNDPDVIVFLAGDNVDANGPLQTTQENLGFSGGGHILVRPTQITTEPNTKHPVAIWGPGGGTAPTEYLQLLTRMASQGFVVIGIRESTGDAVLMSAAIDWLEEQDADPSSPMYERLILDRVGVFGHSMGGLSSEATAAADDRVSTALLDNSGSLSHNGLVNVTVPVGIIYGEAGIEAENAVPDYNNPGNKGPLWLGMMKGGGHGSGPWDGAGANVAWMRWHLGGENERKAAFLGDGGDYNDQGVWVTEFKQWDGWKNWNE